jgi:hypothetical protein
MQASLPQQAVNLRRWGLLVIKACAARGCQSNGSYRVRLRNPANGRIDAPIIICNEHFELVRADGLLADHAPETAKPETAKPETAKPETAKPETAKPETEKQKPKLKTSKPKPKPKPKTAKPDQTLKPESAKRIETEILAAIAAHPTGLFGTQIKKLITCRSSTISDLLVRLEKEGCIRRTRPSIRSPYIIQEQKTSMTEQTSKLEKMLAESERARSEAVNGRAAALRQTVEIEAKLRKAYSRISELEKLLAHATAPAIEANTHAMTLDEAASRFEAFTSAKRSAARADELRSSGHDGLAPEEVNLLTSHHANRADLLMRYALTGKQ